MNYGAIRGRFVHARHIPSTRIAFATSVALILLTGGLMTFGQSKEAGAGAEIRATGSFTTIFVLPTITTTNSDFPIDPDPTSPPNQGLNNPNIAERTRGALVIFSRYALSAFTTGSLIGKAVSLHTNARDDELEKAFVMTTGTFWGTLNGLQGSYSFRSHFVADRSRCDEPGVPVPCPGNVIPIEGKLVVIEGTGMGGLEGICGGGIFKSALPLGTGTDYDFTFRFGEDCKANN